MFSKDKKRIITCIEREDFYSALEYANLVKDKYTDREKLYFENIINYVKSGGNYKF